MSSPKSPVCFFLIFLLFFNQISPASAVSIEQALNSHQVKAKADKDGQTKRVFVRKYGEYYQTQLKGRLKEGPGNKTQDKKKDTKRP